MSLAILRARGGGVNPCRGHRYTLAAGGEQLQISRERVRQIENEALQKLRRLDGERLFAYHQEL